MTEGRSARTRRRAGLRARSASGALLAGLLAAFVLGTGTSYAGSAGSGSNTTTHTTETVAATASTGVAREYDFGLVWETEPSANCGVTIQWGDGSSSPASLGSAGTGGEREVTATHAYAAAGSYEAVQEATPSEKCQLGARTVTTITVGDFVIGTNTNYNATVFQVTVTDPPAPPPPPAPQVEILSGPAPETAEPSATFAFRGTAGGSYECSIDDGAWQPCSSGQAFGPLLPDDHRFQVRETLAGLTSLPASYGWTIDLPPQCILRVARARAFVYTSRDKARLVINYTAYRPAKVTVSYKLKGRKGGLDLGSITGQFKTKGIFRLPVRLSAAQMRKVRAATSFTVHFRIPKAPGSCGRYYAKQLTIPQKVSKQTVWFQSDSRFAP